MKKDIEKYINDNINAEVPKSLSKDGIVSKLDDSKIELLPPKKSNKKSTVLKFVAVAASLALVISGVAIWSQTKKPIQKSESIKDSSYNSDYQAVYEKMDELHKAYANSNNIGTYDEMVLEEVAPSDSINKGEITGDALNGAFGTTNTQENGIDEGDVIKTDGKNIYLVDSENHCVHIVDVTGDESNTVSKIAISNEDSYINEIYLYGTKLVVIYNVYDYSKTNFNNKNGAELYSYYCDCCNPTWIYTDTHVNIYDVSNALTPTLQKEITMNGAYVSSRLVDGKLYTVSSYGVNVSEDDYKSKCIPEITVNGDKSLVPADKITIVEETDSPTYAVVNTTDLDSLNIIDNMAVLGDAQYVYATTKSLYLVDGYYNTEKCTTFSKIMKFELTESGVKFNSFGLAEGRINDNLSMSEQGDYFRIATTYDKVEIDGSGDDATVSYLGESNALYIFDKDMKNVGKLCDIAEGEIIRSARYVGNYLYLVTFRQTDPLFVIDLSDSTNPKIVGEVKLPGFSRYLHPVGDGLLIGVGEDGTEEGINGNMKVSLFSVADPANPVEISKLLVSGEDGDAYSNLSYDYKAFVNLPNGEFCIPFGVYDGGENYYKVMFVRYKVENNEVKEIARYLVGNDSTSIIGGTYVGDYFYAYSRTFVDSKDTPWKSSLAKFNLKTNENVTIITLN